MTDYLTNDTDLTSVADAIRTKGGTSASLEFPDGFVDAIEEIPTGGGAITVANLSCTFEGVTFDNDVEVILQKPTIAPIGASNWSGYNSFHNATGKKLTIRSSSGHYCNTLERCFYGAKFDEITLDIASYPSGRFLWQYFMDGTNCPVVNGEIDLSGCIYMAPSTFNNRYIQEIRFKNNSLSLEDAYPTAYLNFRGASNDSLVSISNALNESISGRSLSVHDSTEKARYSAIVGTVALDETQTYHIFTADTSGTVTLADFITNTKGWTLA